MIIFERHLWLRLADLLQRTLIRDFEMREKSLTISGILSFERAVFRLTDSSFQNLQK